MATKELEPDLILINGRIATQDESRSFAQAVAIQKRPIRISRIQ